MKSSNRPAVVRVYVALLLVSAAVMALIGWAASAYFVPALCLLLQAILLWRGRGLRVFQGIVLILNQVGGLVLILVLWLGDGLGDAKLDISGVALLRQPAVRRSADVACWRWRCSRRCVAARRLLRGSCPRSALRSDDQRPTRLSFRHGARAARRPAALAPRAAQAASFTRQGHTA